MCFERGQFPTNLYTHPDYQVIAWHSIAEMHALILLALVVLQKSAIQLSTPPSNFKEVKTRILEMIVKDTILE